MTLAMANIDNGTSSDTGSANRGGSSSISSSDLSNGAY